MIYSPPPISKVSKDPAQAYPESEAESNFRESCYFPYLDSLRFFAALAVFVHHFEQIKSEMGFPSLWHSTICVQLMGKEGVRLFFVLSGFLITFFLLKELHHSGKINLGTFYARRILRIWPLYFLTVFLAFFVLPTMIELPSSSSPGLHMCVASVFDDFWTKLCLFLCFLPNLCLRLFAPVPAGAHCWSLGVEEQFYLFWPCWLFMFRKNIPLGLASSVFLKFGVAIAVSYVISHSTLRYSAEFVNYNRLFQELLSTIDAESFCLGGFAAYLFFSKKLIVCAEKTRPILLIVLCVIFLGNAYTFPFRELVMSISFAVLVLILASFKKKQGMLMSLSREMGKISYGIYMFHPIVLFLFLQYIPAPFWSKDLSAVLSLPILLVVFFLVVILSYVSFRYFETPFLRLKKLLAPGYKD